MDLIEPRGEEKVRGRRDRRARTRSGRVRSECPDKALDAAEQRAEGREREGRQAVGKARRVLLELAETGLQLAERYLRKEGWKRTVSIGAVQCSAVTWKAHSVD